MKARGRHIRMAEPFLDLGNIGLVVERVRGGRRPQQMNAEAFHMSRETCLAAIFADDVVINGIRIELTVELTGAVLRHWPEEGTRGIILVAGERQVLINQTLGHRIHRHEADFVALAFDPEVRRALAALDIPHPLAAELPAAHIQPKLVFERRPRDERRPPRVNTV
jgi:hypothetical protein